MVEVMARERVVVEEVTVPVAMELEVVVVVAEVTEVGMLDMVESVVETLVRVKAPLPFLTTVLLLELTH